jgi:hypothetical protein
VGFHGGVAFLEIHGFKVANEQAIGAEEQRVIAPTRFAKSIEHFRPDPGMTRFVLIHPVGANFEQETDTHCTSRRIHLQQQFCFPFELSSLSKQYYNHFRQFRPLFLRRTVPEKTGMGLRGVGHRRGPEAIATGNPGISAAHNQRSAGMSFSGRRSAFQQVQETETMAWRPRERVWRPSVQPVWRPGLLCPMGFEKCRLKR